MSATIGDADDADARTAAARLIRRRRRQGFPVVILERGREWEVMEPEGCAMVPDACGVLYISRETFGCRECGCDYDTRDDAAQCCAVDDWREGCSDAP
jgi:hypothetical protein